MNDKYILIDDIPVPEPDVHKWGEWIQKNSRTIAHDTVTYGGYFGQDEKVRVSTVFLGIDRSFGGSPILFETMIFGGKHDQYQERYATIEEAKEGHQKAIKMLKETIL